MRSRRASGSRRRPRTSSSASASRPARPSTCSASPAPTSISTGSRELPDEEVTARLVAIRGLGEWTADWFLARHLARPHAWPAGDLGLRKAVAAFYGDVPTCAPSPTRFHPFENLTAHYLLTGRVVPPA